MLFGTEDFEVGEGCSRASVLKNLGVTALSTRRSFSTVTASLDPEAP